MELKKDGEIFRAPLYTRNAVTSEKNGKINISLEEKKWNLNLLYTLRNKFVHTDFKSKLSSDFSKDNILDILNSFRIVPEISESLLIPNTTKSELKSCHDYALIYVNVKSFGIYDNATLSIYEETKKVVEENNINEDSNIYKIFESNFDYVEEENGDGLVKAETFCDKNQSFLNESKFYNITKVDYSQARLVKIAKESDLLIQGPPGTGKTETILNVVSDMVLNNLKVLIVSEKKVALDVLYKRISSESTGLRKMSLYLKGTDSSSKNSFLEQIRDSFEGDVSPNFEKISDVVYPLTNNERTNFIENAESFLEKINFEELKIINNLMKL